MLKQNPAAIDKTMLRIAAIQQGVIVAKKLQCMAQDWHAIIAGYMAQAGCRLTCVL